MISQEGFRVEVVIGSVVMPLMLDNLKKNNFHKYTLIRHATGNGSIFERSADDVTDVFSVDLLILLIPRTQYPELETILSPLIKTYGGVVSVTECRLMTI